MGIRAGVCVGGALVRRAGGEAGAACAQNARFVVSGREGCSRPLTRKNVALLAAVDRLLEFGPGGEFCYFAGRNLDCGSGLRVAPVAGFSLRDGESAEADQRYSVSFF